MRPTQSYKSPHNFHRHTLHSTSLSSSKSSSLASPLPSPTHSNPIPSNLSHSSLNSSKYATRIAVPSTSLASPSLDNHASTVSISSAGCSVEYSVSAASRTCAFTSLLSIVRACAPPGRGSTESVAGARQSSTPACTLPCATAGFSAILAHRAGTTGGRSVSTVGWL
ncbi:hypothetical protein K461DRAFT_282185 [Myriangium duriaei CBS 260.36]|uniref:Uncharacterized protein n=1 Tax=Myriangium duriaei CBS 260.36 TaxID=1168546 RepID=A0A9P4IUG7_9PEZI|nr:hypothetical protein K461DRAFT_282185 [Myriangium duriaei CBS 260.36]